MVLKVVGVLSIFVVLAIGLRKSDKKRHSQKGLHIESRSTKETINRHASSLKKREKVCLAFDFISLKIYKMFEKLHKEL